MPKFSINQISGYLHYDGKSYKCHGHASLEASLSDFIPRLLAPLENEVAQLKAESAELKEQLKWAEYDWNKDPEKVMPPPEIADGAANWSKFPGEQTDE